MGYRRSISKTILIALTAFFVCLSSLALVFGVNRSEVKTASAQTIEVNTASMISKQGENGMFYCWGNIDQYMPMEWLIWNHEWTWKGPYENYAQITGQFIHPGQKHDTLYVWVADHSGTVSIAGNIYRSVDANPTSITTNGDGCDFVIVHQKRNEQVTLMDVAARTKDKHEINQSVTIAKGDSIVISVSSGIAHNNVMDTTYCNIKITYTEHGGDFVFGEDLSKYLRSSNAGAVSGYRHIEGSFEADILNAEETIDRDETKVIIRTETPANALSSDLTTSELSGIIPSTDSSSVTAIIILSIVVSVTAVAVVSSIVLIRRKSK